MGRIRTIGEKGPAETPLSYRAAREVSRGLRARGWAITAALCRGKTPTKIAWFLCAPVTGQQERLAREIAELCGYVPLGGSNPIDTE